jgi:hypothetical protein
MKAKPKSHIFEHIITSIIGTVIMAFSALYVWYNIKTLSFENIGVAAALGVVGFMFLASKDTWIKSIFNKFASK